MSQAPGPEQWAAMFDALAGDYDQSGVPFFGPIAHGLADRLALLPGERVAELGAGRGALTLPMAEAVGPTGRVDAVDIAPGMVERLRESVAGAGQVQVALGDAADPPLEAGGYDVAAASLVLFFLPDPMAALTRWRGLLRGGGRVGISTFCPWLDTWLAIEDVFAEVGAEHGGEQQGTSPTTMPEPFHTDAGVERLFIDAGFTSVRSDHEVLTVPFDGLEQWRTWSMGTAMRGLWAGIPEEHHPLVLERIAGLLDEERGTDGRSRLQVEVRYTLAG